MLLPVYLKYQLFKKKNERQHVICGILDSHLKTLPSLGMVIEIALDQNGNWTWGNPKLNITEEDPNNILIKTSKKENKPNPVEYLEMIGDSDPFDNRDVEPEVNPILYSIQKKNSHSKGQN